MLGYAVYCPNCDYRLWVEEEVNNYTILDGRQVVHNCPKCFIPLIIVNGELKKDE